MATENATADTLDLITGSRRSGRCCLTGEAEIYIARRVAKLSGTCPPTGSAIVDRAVARIIARESGGRVLAVAEAKIIEADPALHERAGRGGTAAALRRPRRAPTSSGCAPSSPGSRPATRSGSRRPWPGSPRSSRRRHPDAGRRRAARRSRSAGWPGPPSCSQLLLEHRDPQETAGPRRRRAEPGDARSRPTCSTRSARSTCRRSRPRRSSTSTCTRPPCAAPVVSLGSRASAR